jgi:hypothetical protein
MCKSASGAKERLKICVRFHSILVQLRLLIFLTLTSVRALLLTRVPDLLFLVTGGLLVGRPQRVRGHYDRGPSYCPLQELVFDPYLGHFLNSPLDFLHTVLCSDNSRSRTVPLRGVRHPCGLTLSPRPGTNALSPISNGGWTIKDLGADG